MIQFTGCLLEYLLSDSSMMVIYTCQFLGTGIVSLLIIAVQRGGCIFISLSSHDWIPGNSCSLQQLSMWLFLSHRQENQYFISFLSSWSPPLLPQYPFPSPHAMPSKLREHTNIHQSNENNPAQGEGRYKPHVYRLCKLHSQAYSKKKTHRR